MTILRPSPRSGVPPVDGGSSRPEHRTAGCDDQGSALATVSHAFETAPASDVVGWAVAEFGAGVTLACSFQNCVLVDLAVRHDPGIDVVFLDTGAHFEETLAYVEEVRARYDLALRIVRPGPEAAGTPCGSTGCCEARKVAPLARALRGRLAWMTGLRRCETPARGGAPIVSWDGARSLVKVNPLATWSDEDVDRYVAEHRLPVHPLVARGYLSIGCAPTTGPVSSGGARRSGRWPGTDRTECGLHV